MFRNTSMARSGDPRYVLWNAPALETDPRQESQADTKKLRYLSTFSTVRKILTDADDSIEESIVSMTSKWLCSIKQNDSDAWRRLIQVYGNLIRWWCSKANVPVQEIDDITQEVFAALSKQLSGFEHQSFRGFLWTITCHKIADFWRAKLRVKSVTVGDELKEILESIEAESNQSSGMVTSATKVVFESIVQLIRSEFSEQDWNLFWEYAVDGKDASVVAELFGVSRNKVFLAKSRILRRIRMELGETGVPAVDPYS
jgi:RNA polymerase sigma-70 factor (ECF subfamily)